MDAVTAWRTNELWRSDFVFWATRELSKTGELCADAQVMRELAAGLHKDEVLWLYAQLKKSNRVTSEWQPQFLGLFLQVSRDDLPPPIFDEEAAIRFAEELRAMSKGVQAEYGRLQRTYPDTDDPIPFLASIVVWRRMRARGRSCGYQCCPELAKSLQLCDCLRQQRFHRARPGGITTDELSVMGRVQSDERLCGH